jgi:hypothetical protein
MPAFICTTCGTQYAPSEKPPAACPICDDERQYVPPPGQGWITLDSLAKRNMNAWRELEPNLISLVTFPAFGIGQRAQLLRTPHGNILWDCISLIDRATVEMINAMGGLKSIAISHPHYYSCMVEWSQAFGGIPIHLHAADRKWIMRDDPAIALWQGETKELLPGVVQDNKSVSFMWSFPNFIPLSAPRVEGVMQTLKPYQFDRVHGAFTDRTIWSDGKGVVERSADRYLKIIRGDGSYELQ